MFVASFTSASRDHDLLVPICDKEGITFTSISMVVSSIVQNSYLSRLEVNLREELNITLAQEEILWKQQLRVKSLKQGDQCTKYFHMSAFMRKRKNTMTTLKDNEGNWYTDPI